MPTIILTGGGSGGHITPLLALAGTLKRKDPECNIIYIGPKGERLEGLQERYGVFDQVCAVPAGKFRRYHGESLLAHLVDVRTLALNFRDAFRVLRGIMVSRRLLRRLKPDLVFSKGSYVAVPVGIAAHQLGMPIITHDSDVVPGLANRIIGRWAAIHAVGQPPENYNYPKDTLRFTGIPVDERVGPVSAVQQRDSKEQLGLPADSPVLLVAGGGLGSQRLNELTLTVAPQLLVKIPKLRIINITGGEHQAGIQAAYDQIPEASGRVQVLGFTADFYKYSAAADLIFSRAGATALAEFAVQKKAVVVIPATQLTGGHQLENTKRLEALGAAEVVDNDVAPEKLLTILASLLQNQQGRESLGTKLGTLAQPDAADKLADIILQTVTGATN